MDKYLAIAEEYYFKGCSIRQAIGIAQDAKIEDERRKNHEKDNQVRVFKSSETAQTSQEDKTFILAYGGIGTWRNI